MKKAYLIAALAITIMVSSVPLHALQKKRISKAIRTAKEKSMKQLDESVQRLKRCIKLQCTRWEALKAARDVTIAAAAVIAAMYGAGTALREGATEARGYDLLPPQVTRPAFRTGKALQYPVTRAREALRRETQPQRELRKNIEEAEELRQW